MESKTWAVKVVAPQEAVYTVTRGVEATTRCICCSPLLTPREQDALVMIVTHIAAKARSPLE
eukprot:scaffold41321_cov66-Phaeocystis_antarctica.AAC.2